jgi:uncharacterized protein with HEPN domain
MKRDLQSLLDMLQSSQIAVSYVIGRSSEEFATDTQFQYDELDLDVIWATVVTSLPSLITELEKAVRSDE